MPSWVATLSNGKLNSPYSPPSSSPLVLLLCPKQPPNTPKLSCPLRQLRATNCPTFQHPTDHSPSRLRSLSFISQNHPSIHSSICNYPLRCASIHSSFLATNHCDRSGSIPLKKFTLPELSITGQRVSSSTRTTASLRKRSTSRTPLTRFTTRFVASSQRPNISIVATSIPRTERPSHIMRSRQLHSP